MQEVLNHWSRFKGAELRSIDVGLINETWFLGAPPEAVIQKVHPIFGPEVHQDILVLTEALEVGGLVTPKLIPTETGALCHVDDSGGLWRVLSYIPGVTHEVMPGTSLAYEAGKLVGRWHKAMDTVNHEFHFKRPGVHDTQAHMNRLSEALMNHRSHPLYEAVARGAEDVLERWERWGGTCEGSLRIAHGDLKLSNLRFDAEGRGVCLLDLDTMGMLSLDVEMGDAWRSWCNRTGEDREGAFFDLDIFEASATGYSSERPFTPQEREGLEWGTERIALELASRFLLDALEESYFGWDAKRFSTRGEHNLTRGIGQLDLARDLASKRDSMGRVLDALGTR